MARCTSSGRGKKEIVLSGTNGRGPGSFYIIEREQVSGGKRSIPLIRRLYWVTMNSCDHNALTGSAPVLSAAVLFTLLLTACSSFGPSPYDNPPYVLDEYGMVYGAVPGASQRDAYLAPRFSTLDAGIGGTYADPWFGLINDPYPGFYAWQRRHYLRAPFYAGGYRAPIYIAPAPRPPPPVTSGPVQPVASPVQAPPEVRFRTEPRLIQARQRHPSMFVPGSTTTRAGSRGQPGAQSRPPRARHAPSPRARSKPRPEPSSRRVIDP